MNSQTMVILDMVANGRLSVDQAIEKLTGLLPRIESRYLTLPPAPPTCFSGATSDVLY